MSDYGVILLFTVIYLTTFICYCSVKRSDISRKVYKNSFVLYSIILILFKFLPMAGEGDINLIALGGFFDGRQIVYYIIELIISVLLFLPLGFLSGMHSMLKGERNPCIKAVALGAVISLISELIQLFPIGKVFAVDHFIFNTLGAFLGIFIFAVISHSDRMQRTLKNLL